MLVQAGSTDRCCIAHGVDDLNRDQLSGNAKKAAL